MFGEMPNFSYNTRLLLRGADKDVLFNVYKDSTLTEGWNKKERTLAGYISEVLVKELAEAGRRERVTDDFVNFLLGVLEFNEDPFRLKLKADCYFRCTIVIGNRLFYMERQIICDL